MAGDDESDTDEELLPGFEPHIPNAGDAKEVASQRRARKFKESQEVEFIGTKLLADPVGRRVLWQWLESLGTFQDQFAAAPAGVPDEMATWYYRGRQSWGYQLYKTLLKIDRLAVCAMHDENDFQFQKQKPKRVMRNENG